MPRGRSRRDADWGGFWCDENGGFAEDVGKREDEPRILRNYMCRNKVDL